MLRYSLILLLVNIHGRSLGVPVPKQSSNGKTPIVMANLLNDLSKQCKNKFVLDQIETKKSTCDVKLDYHVGGLQCLLFYDANRLLCNSTTDLNAEIMSKISDKQNVSTFCNEISHLSVPSSSYQKTIITVFQGEEYCKRVCADDDITTADTNFFCKYYMQTLLMVLPPQSVQQQHALASTANSTEASGVTAPKNDSTVLQASHATDGQDKNTSVTVPIKTQTVKANETNQDTSEAKQGSSPMAQLSNQTNPENLNLPSNVYGTNKKFNEKVIAESNNNILDTGNKAGENKGQSNPNVNPIDDGNEIGIENNGGNRDPDVSIQQIETPGNNVGLENANDDGGDIDADEDDRDPTDDEDISGSDVRARLPETQDPNTRPETQGAQIVGGSQKEFFQTTDGFTEDDDHFFPFFLTAVIVVVVLYILYHNKNKVGKMFFGLIVEGRQTGRRRNSRGHAYRRLDTLEQAMSTNTTAPPSKIIY